MTLQVLPGSFAVCEVDRHTVLITAQAATEFLAVVFEGDRATLVCAESEAPEGDKIDRGWRALRLEGVFEFSECGILAALAVPLAAAGVGIFALSTFDTDYVLVKASQLEQAREALTSAGFEFAGS